MPSSSTRRQSWSSRRSSKRWISGIGRRIFRARACVSLGRQKWVMPSCEVSDDAVNIDIRTSTIRTVAGNGTAGRSGEGGPAIAASLNEPKALGLDGRDNLLIADSENHVIRKVDRQSGIIVTVAGSSGK